MCTRAFLVLAGVLYAVGLSMCDHVVAMHVRDAHEHGHACFAGIAWAVDDSKKRVGKKAVLSMSLGGGGRGYDYYCAIS